MNMTVPLENSHLNCKAIVDLIDNFECMFMYDYSERLGYVHFENKTDLYMFIERLEDITNNIQMLDNLYEKEDYIMSASTYINIEITYQSDKDKFYIDYIYNDKVYYTKSFYDTYSILEYLTNNLFMNYDEANNLINDVLNNS